MSLLDLDTERITLTYSREALLKLNTHNKTCAKQLAPDLPKELIYRQRGKRGGINRTAKQHRKLPLPPIVFGNARSINNKTDELAALIKYHHADRNASAIAITETWLNDKITDSHVSFEGFDVFRADRDSESCDKTKGGGCLWLIRRAWCTNTTLN